MLNGITLQGQVVTKAKVGGEVTLGGEAILGVEGEAMEEATEAVMVDGVRGQA